MLTWNHTEVKPSPGPLTKGRQKFRNMDKSDRTLPCFLGAGAEGCVYRVSDNLVRKVWFNNWFGGYTEILERLNRVIDMVRDHPFLHVPEFVAYEYNDEGALVTYHQYVEGPPMYQWTQDLMNRYYDHRDIMFADEGGDNIRYCPAEDRFYLIDVA